MLVSKGQEKQLNFKKYFQSGTGGKNYEENKNMMQKKVIKVNLVCTSLLLSYNKIKQLAGFDKVIDSVMYDCKNLQWLDISHNYLEALDYVKIKNLTK